MPNKSRAEYYRKRRESFGQLNIEVPKDKLMELESTLAAKGKTKTQWINDKIDEELSKK